MGDFGANYAKGKPTKDCGNHPVPRKNINRQQVNNATVNNLVEEILLNEAQKLCAVREAPEFWYSGHYDNNLYHVERISLEDTK